MPLFPPTSKDSAIKYVTGTQGKDGGYLFYQYVDVFESAIDDTFYALSVFKLLEVEPPRIELTLKFLRSKVANLSLYIFYYSLNALEILGTMLKMPRETLDFVYSLKEDQGILGKLKEHRAIGKNDIRRNEEISQYYESNEIFEIELRPELELAFMILDCHRKLGFKISEKERQEWSKAVLNYLRPDGGFGSGISDIHSTCYAIKILNILEYPTEDLSNVTEWILGLEDSSGGFNITHESRFRTVEYTYEAVEALRLLKGRPKRPTINADFLLQCQNANGGFRRSFFVGISTLKDTFQAVAAVESLLGHDGGQTI